ncbi:MAG TPA: M28 family peptidase, partial [Actinomycetota bacterium]|nr:M28 family peptidase [Actinomycetota bacterium]
IGYRASGSEGDERAATHQAEVLRSLGLEVELDDFPLPQGGVSWNVIGRPPGFAYDRPYLIVGGHYDSLNGPGANDNATGIGVSLELMRVLAERPASLPVVYIGFGAEERQPYPERVNHVGSRHHVATMNADQKANLTAFLNVDMVGRGDVLIAGRLRTGSREATQRLLDAGRRTGVPVTERVTPDWSDHGPFLKAGMNAGWIWAGEDPLFHSPRDTFDRVQPHLVERAGRLALAFLRSYP